MFLFSLFFYDSSIYNNQNNRKIIILKINLVKLIFSMYLKKGTKALFKLCLIDSSLTEGACF